MASQRVMSMGKKILAGVLVASVLAVSMGDRIRMQSKELVESAQSNSQDNNMEWRGKREGGNSFAKYAGAAVFAPLIFTIPFPTFNQANESQLLQVQLSGGSYIKNIFSFFVIMVMFMMLISGEWRRHVFILAYTVGYLMVLVMSNFAQSGRFHMPVWPMMMLFAAYGIQIAKTNGKMKRWFTLVLVAEVFICIAWNWFKLKGRGMI
jgi:F0F1-type ATP synthase assembly protein I